MEKYKVDLGILFLRLFSGGLMLVVHGLPKLLNFGDKMNNFPDPIGVGSKISLGLAVSAEVFAAFFLILGLKTRLSSIPLMITMLVAIVVVHAQDPFSFKEVAIMYFICFGTLLFTGGGRISLDQVLFKK